MDEARKKKIEDSVVVVSIIPEGGVEGSQGEEDLLYAVGLQKPILIWRPTPAENKPFPEILKDVKNVHECVGSEEDLLGKLIELELAVGRGFNLVSAAYDKTKKIESH